MNQKTTLTALVAFAVSALSASAQITPALDPINVGTPNGGNGDTLREAFVRVNNNEASTTNALGVMSNALFAASSGSGTNLNTNTVAQISTNSVLVTAGANVTVTPTRTGNTVSYSVASTASGGGSNSVSTTDQNINIATNVANYTIALNPTQQVAQINGGNLVLTNQFIFAGPGVQIIGKTNIVGNVSSLNGTVAITTNGTKLDFDASPVGIGSTNYANQIGIGATNNTKSPNVLVRLATFLHADQNNGEGLSAISGDGGYSWDFLVRQDTMAVYAQIGTNLLGYLADGDSFYEPDYKRWIVGTTAAYDSVNGSNFWRITSITNFASITVNATPVYSYTGAQVDNRNWLNEWMFDTASNRMCMMFLRNLFSGQSGTNSVEYLVDSNNLTMSQPYDMNGDYLTVSNGLGYDSCVMSYSNSFWMLTRHNDATPGYGTNYGWDLSQSTNGMQGYWYMVKTNFAVSQVQSMAASYKSTEAPKLVPLSDGTLLFFFEAVPIGGTSANNVWVRMQVTNFASPYTGIGPVIICNQSTNFANSGIRQPSLAELSALTAQANSYIGKGEVTTPAYIGNFGRNSPDAAWIFGQLSAGVFQDFSSGMSFYQFASGSNELSILPWVGNNQTTLLNLSQAPDIGTITMGSQVPVFFPTSAVIHTNTVEVWHKVGQSYAMKLDSGNKGSLLANGEIDAPIGNISTNIAITMRFSTNTMTSGVWLTNNAAATNRAVYYVSFSVATASAAQSYNQIWVDQQCSGTVSAAFPFVTSSNILASAETITNTFPLFLSPGDRFVVTNIGGSQAANISSVRQGL